ncbi:hypothetical protein ACFU7Y_37605 [Kitasatospora sp. NPDC057542]|uniref:hypothetical protein n=1 Tax=Kitasatospora sp. NPDC057542 TaxID=3346162 RepID=UPI0036B2544E
MPARVRTKRRSSLAPIRVSQLRRSSYNLRSGELRTVVCPGCEIWRQIVGDKTLTIRDHYSTDLGGAELAAGQRDRRCPSARRIVLLDLTADEITAWAKEQDRRMKTDALPAETRRAARQHYKPMPAVPGPVHLMATPRPATEHTASERAEQWKKLLSAVEDANDRRAEPLVGSTGPIRGIDAPRETLRPAA